MKAHITSLSKLFRWRPVTAWGVVGIMIAVACAFHSGLSIDVLALFYVTGVILLVQGIVAHGVNDLADIEVDRIAPIEETGRSKVLVTGEMTRDKMLAILCSAGLAAFLLVIYLAMRAGPYVFVFAAFAAFAVFGYSCKPIRLGWRPFSELTVVVPTITMLILGVEYVAIGTVTPLAVVMGLSYGFFNASWFMYSRAQDYGADKAMRKATTIVKYGLPATPEFAVMYLVVGCVFAIWAALMTEWFTGIVIMMAYVVPAVGYISTMKVEKDYLRPRPLPAGKRMHYTSPGMVSDSPPYWSPCVCSVLRVSGIRMAVLYGVLASLAIIVGGLLWT